MKILHNIIFKDKRDEEDRRDEDERRKGQVYVRETESE